MITTVPQRTDAGKALLMRALMGETLTFTRIAIGSGELETGRDPDELTELIREELSITPASMDDSQEGLIAISGDFNSGDVTNDFIWRELGVYAMGEDETEVLYAYANDGDDAGVLKAITSDLLIEQTLTLIVEIDDAENVNAIFNPHTEYAPAVTLAGHMNNQSNPHSVTKEQVGLGNVPNKTPENVTVAFTAASEQANIATGEKLSVMFGKIAKVITDTIAHITANTGNPHGVKMGQMAVAGTYTGDGTQGRTISTSSGGTAFNPSAVMVWDEFGRTYNADKGVCGGLALSSRGIRVPNSLTADDATTWANSYTALMCVTGGFKVNQYTGETAEDSIDTNESGVVYHYIAWM